MSFIIKDKKYLILDFHLFKIKIRKNKNYLYTIKSHFNKHLIKFKLKNKKPYLIIPFSSYCFSRCMTTFSGIKPKRKDGEKTLPFDLTFFLDFDKVLDLFETNFESFFNGVTYNSEEKIYENKDLNAIFVHDGELNKEEFESRYKKRIKNFYEYINTKDKHLYFVIGTTYKITGAQIERAKNLIEKYQDKNNYDIILINQNEEDNNITTDNFFVINQGYNYENFDKINHDRGWVDEVKRIRNKTAYRVFYDVVFELLKILKDK